MSDYMEHTKNFRKAMSLDDELWLLNTQMKIDQMKKKKGAFALKPHQKPGNLQSSITLIENEISSIKREKKRGLNKYLKRAIPSRKRLKYNNEDEESEVRRIRMSIADGINSYSATPSISSRNSRESRSRSERSVPHSNAFRRATRFRSSKARGDGSYHMSSSTGSKENSFEANKKLTTKRSNIRDSSSLSIRDLDSSKYDIGKNLSHMTNEERRNYLLRLSYQNPTKYSYFSTGKYRSSRSPFKANTRSLIRNRPEFDSRVVKNSEFLTEMSINELLNSSYAHRQLKTVKLSDLLKKNQKSKGYEHRLQLANEEEERKIGKIQNIKEKVVIPHAPFFYKTHRAATEFLINQLEDLIGESDWDEYSD